MARFRTLGAGIVLLIVLLPLLGAAIAGRDLRALFRFPPPDEIPGGYVTFSWLAAAAVMTWVGALLTPWFAAWRRVAPPRGERRSDFESSRVGFPGWGWAAVAWTGGWWVLAWTRWDWFEPLQRYTFFPLWLGFIVSFNALAERRTGSCLMRRAPRRWLALFAASAGCWWGFEWLNRFVLNWHYLGAESFGPASYALHATLCFSTVLPATAAVAEWIGSHPAWATRTAAGPRLTWLDNRAAAAALFTGGALGLVATGMWPLWCYPAL